MPITLQTLLDALKGLLLEREEEERDKEEK